MEILHSPPNYSGSAITKLCKPDSWFFHLAAPATPATQRESPAFEHLHGWKLNIVTFLLWASSSPKDSNHTRVCFLVWVQQLLCFQPSHPSDSPRSSSPCRTRGNPGRSGWKIPTGGDFKCGTSLNAPSTSPSVYSGLLTMCLRWIICFTCRKHLLGEPMKIVCTVGCNFGTSMPIKDSKVPKSTVQHQLLVSYQWLDTYAALGSSGPIERMWTCASWVKWVIEYLDWRKRLSKTNLCRRRSLREGCKKNPEKVWSAFVGKSIYNGQIGFYACSCFKNKLIPFYKTGLLIPRILDSGTPDQI